MFFRHPERLLSLLLIFIGLILCCFAKLQSENGLLGNEIDRAAVEKPDPPKMTTLQVQGSGENRIVVFTMIPPESDFDEYHIRQTTTVYEDSSPSASIIDYTSQDLYIDKSQTKIEIPYSEPTDGTVSNASWGIWTRKTTPTGGTMESDPPSPEHIKLLQPVVSDTET